MMRKIGFTLLAAALLTPPAFATTEHILRQGLGIEYELPANDPQIFSNIFLWQVKATCIIISENTENSITIKMLKKTGTVNSIPLTAEPMVLKVQSGEKLIITADSRAKVELINHGDKAIKASCTS